VQTKTAQLRPEEQGDSGRPRHGPAEHGAPESTLPRTRWEMGNGLWRCKVLLHRCPARTGPGTELSSSALEPCSCCRCGWPALVQNDVNMVRAARLGPSMRPEPEQRVEWPEQRVEGQSTHLELGARGCESRAGGRWARCLAVHSHELPRPRIHHARYGAQPQALFTSQVFFLG
jgi:hypothetical protein